MTPSPPGERRKRLGVLWSGNCTQSSNMSRPVWRKLGVATAAVTGLLTVFIALNPGGWRARILARVLRVENRPRIVSPPPTFQPRVPPGFNVSVFARGFEEPRWLAVAPDGDVFMADSAAGQVIVLADRQKTGRAESREVFASHLNLPFGIAFRDDYAYVANTNEVVRFRYDPETSRRLGNARNT